MNQQPEQSRTNLYAHITSSGEIFILANDVGVGTWVDTARFKAELQRLKDTDGFLLLSWEEDNPEEGSPQRILEDLVRSYEIAVGFEEYPHPAVFGYYRSFAKLLWRAVDVANHDVEGTQEQLDKAHYWLGQVQEGTTDHSFWKEEVERLTKQLTFVEMAYKKLKDLDLELTCDPEGGEN